MFAAAIHRGRIDGGQRRPGFQALHQIRVGDEQAAEGDQVELAGCASLLGQRQVVAVIGNVQTVEQAAHDLQVETLRELARAAGGRKA